MKKVDDKYEIFLKDFLWPGLIDLVMRAESYEHIVHRMVHEIGNFLEKDFKIEAKTNEHD